MTTVQRSLHTHPVNKLVFDRPSEHTSRSRLRSAACSSGPAPAARVHRQTLSEPLKLIKGPDEGWKKDMQAGAAPVWNRLVSVPR